MIGNGSGVFTYDEVKRRHEELLCAAEQRRRFERAGLQEPSLARDVALQTSRLLIRAGTWLKDHYEVGSAGHEFSVASATADR